MGIDPSQCSEEQFQELVKLATTVNPEPIAAESERRLHEEIGDRVSVGEIHASEKSIVRIMGTAQRKCAYTVEKGSGVFCSSPRRRNQR